MLHVPDQLTKNPRLLGVFDEVVTWKVVMFTTGISPPF